MNTYEQRVTRFFLQSLHTLKKESGAQRWNDICNDTIELVFQIAPNYFPSFLFSKETIWQLFFHPPQTIQESVLLVFFSTQEKSPDFLFTLLRALTDPPRSWWTDIKEH